MGRAQTFILKVHDRIRAVAYQIFRLNSLLQIIVQNSESAKACSALPRFHQEAQNAYIAELGLKTDQDEARSVSSRRQKMVDRLVLIMQQVSHEMYQ